MPKRYYGYKPDLADQRDKRFKATEPITGLPPSVDLRPKMPLPCFDQQALGACVAHSTAGAVVFDQFKQNIPVSMPSRLFLYYWARAIEGSIMLDSGCTVRDMFKAYNRRGVCPESEWPYDISKFTDWPNWQDEQDAAQHKPISYARTDSTRLKATLASGYPIVFGFTVYESFESDAVATSGIMPMPQSGESVVGGHSVLMVGYQDSTADYICRNSWGTGWGINGYFLMPYAYVAAGLADDFWVLTTVR